MKKIYKINIIVFILTLFSFINNVHASEVYTNDLGVRIQQVEYSNLLSLGFSEEEIKMMPSNIYNENKNLKGEILGKDTRYFKTIYYYKDDKLIQHYSLNSDMLLKHFSYEVPEEEYNKDNNVMLYDANATPVNTEYKKLETSIIKVNSRYRVKNVLTWKKIPATRGNDVFSIAINNAVVEPLANSEHAFTSYTQKNSCTLDSLGKSINHTKWSKGSSGYGVVVTLPRDETKTYEYKGIDNYPCWKKPYYDIPIESKVNASLSVIAIQSTMYYDLVKIIQAPISAYGSYQHAQKKLSLDNISFSITYGAPSISFNASIKKYFDGMGETHAQELSPKW